MKKLFLLLTMISTVFVSGCIKYGSPTTISNTNVSGLILTDQIWSENIRVTGDIIVMDGTTLTILPGTVVKVAAFSDDQNSGKDHPHDPPFPKDPDRKETQSTQIIIRGILNATGTPDKRIVFTSDNERPTTYDWDGLQISHGRLEYAIVEYARYNNLQESSDVVIANNIIRNALECCLCIGHSKPISPQILNNEIYNCGHEAIDNAGGSAVIMGNYFHLENPEIQPDPSMGRHGVVIYQYSYPIIENNRFENLENAIIFLHNNRNEREEMKRVIIRNNTIKDNAIAFCISPGYPTDEMDAVVMGDNNLINNDQDEVREQ